MRVWLWFLGVDEIHICTCTFIVYNHHGIYDCSSTGVYALLCYQIPVFLEVNTPDIAMLKLIIDHGISY